MGWMKEKWKEESGLTLVEILVSILILSLVIISASAAFIHSTKTSADQQIRLTAMNLANGRMEQIRALEFADIGTRIFIPPSTYISGDPAGLILQEEKKNINGIEYLLQTNIAWEEKAEWSMTSSAEWDYKVVKITVTPSGYESGSRLSQSLESYITRDWAQPALKGSHIQFRAVEGWTLPGHIKKPIFGINAMLVTGPNAPRLIQTSTKGVGSFLGLNAGNHGIKLDGASSHYMLHPSQSQLWEVLLAIDTDKTEKDEFEFAKPCGVTFTLKNLTGDIITQSDIPAGGKGKITLSAPYPIGAVIDKEIERTDVSGSGKIGSSVVGDLWPVGEGYSGSYGINFVSLEGFQYIGYYLNQGGLEIPWDGRFTNQGTVQDIVLYFTQAPAMPADINTNWSDSNGIIPSGSHYAVDHEGNAESGAKLATDDVTKTLLLQQGSSVDFNSLRIYIENTGTPSSPGLMVKKNGKLNLRSGEIIIRGTTVLEKGDSLNGDGKIVLRTSWENGQDVSYYQGHQIPDSKADDSRPYGKIYLSSPMYLGADKILLEGGYYFPDGTILPDHANQLIPFSKENYIG